MSSENFDNATRNGSGEVSSREVTAPTSFENEALARKYWRTEEWSFPGGRKLHVCGVAHTDATLAIPEYREHLEDLIKETPKVIVEAAPEALEAYTMKDMKKVLDILEASGLQLTDEEKGEVLMTAKDEGRDFFHQVEEIVKIHDAELFVMDPHSGQGPVALTLNNLYPAEASVLASKTLLAAVGLSSAAAAAILDRKYHIKTPLDTDEKEPKSESGMNRRTFLKAMGAVGAATALGGVGTIVSQYLEYDIENEEQPPAMTRISFLDYRNVIIALGIRDLMERGGEEGGDLSLIYGALHIDPIKEYLDSPALLDTKYALYEVIFGDTPMFLSGFRFNKNSPDGTKGDEEKWQRTTWSKVETK